MKNKSFRMVAPTLRERSNLYTPIPEFSCTSAEVKFDACVSRTHPLGLADALAEGAKVREKVDQQPSDPVILDFDVLG